MVDLRIGMSTTLISRIYTEITICILLCNYATATNIMDRLELHNIYS